AKCWGEKDFPRSDLPMVCLVGVPLQSDKFGHPMSLRFHIIDHVFVPRLDPVKATQAAQPKPYIHKVRIMFRGSLETKEIYVGGSQHEVLKKTTDHHIPRIPQSDDNLRMREQPQPKMKGGRWRGIFVQQQICPRLAG